MIMNVNEQKQNEFDSGPPDDRDQAFAEKLSESDQLTAELAAANDRALRLQAEMQNLRNRTSREIADERRYAALPMLRDLLPVVDNIDRAIEAAEKGGRSRKAAGRLSAREAAIGDDCSLSTIANRFLPKASRSTRIFTRQFCSSRRPMCRPTTS